MFKVIWAVLFLVVGSAAVLADVSQDCVTEKRIEADERISACDETIKRAPKYVKAYMIRGEAYEAKGDNELALRDYNEAVKLEPTDWEVFNSRGTFYFHQRQYERAAGDYGVAARLNPNQPIPWLNRCKINTIRGRLNAALWDCNTSLNLTTIPEALQLRGIIYLKMGRFERAILDFDRAMKLFPNSAQTLYARGIAKLKKGDKAVGDADIAAATAMKADVTTEFAIYDVR